MKPRSMIQGYLVVVLIAIHLLLIFKFFADFTAYDFSTLEPLYDLGNMLVGPFRGTFEASVTDGAVFDFSTIFAMLGYGGVWLVLTAISKVGQYGTILDKLLHFNDILFKIINSLFITRLIFTFLEIKESPFILFVEETTNLLIKPLHLILPVDMEGRGVLRIEIGLSIIFILFFWGIAQKLIRTFIKAPRDIPYGTPYLPKKQETLQEKKPALSTQINPDETVTHKGFTPSQPKKAETKLPSYTYKSGPKFNQEISSASKVEKQTKPASKDSALQKDPSPSSDQAIESKEQISVQPSSEVKTKSDSIQTTSASSQHRTTQEPAAIRKATQINTRKDTTIDKITRQINTFFIAMKEFIIEIVSKEKDENIDSFEESNKRGGSNKSPLQN